MTTALDRSISNMDGAAALPRDNGELVFAAPWEGRSLAMAVALVEKLGLEWDEFRQRLVRAIADDRERPYYESWACALEDLVVAQGITGPGELDGLSSSSHS